MGQSTLGGDRRPGAYFEMPSDDGLRCLWIKLGDRLAVLGFRPARGEPAGHDVDLADRLAPVDVWRRDDSPDDQVWLWGTGLIELTVAGHQCHLAYAASTVPTAESATVIAETASAFVRLCDGTRDRRPDQARGGQRWSGRRRPGQWGSGQRRT